MSAKKMPNKSDQIISKLRSLCESSCPPLNPIDKSKYSDINLEELGGISKSLLSCTASMPRKKNRRAGFVKLSNNKCKSIKLIIARTNLSLAVYFTKEMFSVPFMTTL